MDKCFFGTHTLTHHKNVRPRVLVRSKIIYRCTMTTATTTRSSLSHFFENYPATKNLGHSCLASFFYRCSTLGSTDTRSTLLQTDSASLARLHILSPTVPYIFYPPLLLRSSPARSTFFPRVCLAHQCVPKRLNQSI